MKRTCWSGVFPAITTQMKRDGSLDLDATARHAGVLIKSGVSGIIFLGSLGENQVMTADEKRRVMEAMIEAVSQVPVEDLDTLAYYAARVPLTAAAGAPASAPPGAAVKR